MKNEKFQILNSIYDDKIKEIKDSAKDYDGFVYVIDLGDKVKIGKTENPVTRLKTLSSMFKNYSDNEIKRIAVSCPHMNYSDNEKELKSVFSEHQVNNGEMFNIDFDTALSKLESLTFETSDELRQAKKADIKKGTKKLLEALYPDGLPVPYKDDEEYEQIIEETDDCNASTSDSDEHEQYIEFRTIKQRELNLSKSKKYHFDADDILYIFTKIHNISNYYEVPFGYVVSDYLDILDELDNETGFETSLIEDDSERFCNVEESLQKLNYIYDDADRNCELYKYRVRFLSKAR